MMSKDSVKKRIEGETGISYTEFAYQLMQGYDFYWLFKNKNCKMQMGGSDQWGNITTGTELIRRKEGGEAFAFTCPLITKADGGKFGKTEKGNIWLDRSKNITLPILPILAKCKRCRCRKMDQDLHFLTKNEMDDLIREHTGKIREYGELQKRLAQEVTVFIHGQDEYQKAVETTEKLFANQSAPIDTMSVEDLESLEGVVRFDYDINRLADRS